jgi:CheY-like chemotaxis protein
MSPPTKPIQSTSPEAAEKRQALILVVERNPVVQRLERFLLEQAGFSVEFANDGEAALARARELHPEIVITEILVPRLDGLSLCRALKSDPETSSMVVLIFSHLQAEERALESGADAFMVKPIDETNLIETVAKLLKIHRQESGG